MLPMQLTNIRLILNHKNSTKKKTSYGLYTIRRFGIERHCTGEDKSYFFFLLSAAMNLKNKQYQNKQTNQCGRIMSCGTNSDNKNPHRSHFKTAPCFWMGWVIRIRPWCDHQWRRKSSRVLHFQSNALMRSLPFYTLLVLFYFPFW